jgi:hypothetical protein
MSQQGVDGNALSAVDPRRDESSAVERFAGGAHGSALMGEAGGESRVL